MLVNDKTFVKTANIEIFIASIINSDRRESISQFRLQYKATA